jgi:hypothetical protein
MAREQKTRSYIPEGGSEEQAAALFQSATDLHQVLPGEFLTDIPIALEVPSLGLRSACVCWLELDEQEALVLFPSFEAYQGAIQTSNPLSAPNVFALLYQEKSEIELSLRREVRRHKWMLSDDKYPSVVCTTFSGEKIDADVRAYQLIQLCCEALTLLLTVYSHSLKKVKESPLTVQFSSKQNEESISVAVQLPHPGIKLGRSTGKETWQEQLLETFFSMDPRIEQEGLTERASYLLMDVLEFKSLYQDEEPMVWSQEDATEFLLSYFPYRVVASEELITATPTILQYFFEWLETIEQIKSARPLVRQLSVQKRIFFQRARDPRFFGEAKATVIKLFRTDLA